MLAVAVLTGRTIIKVHGLLEETVRRTFLGQNNDQVSKGSGSAE